MAPGGACPVGRRITLPFRHPAGGLPSLSPVYPAFCLLSCPHPLTRARRALFPAGRGNFVILCRGFAPCIPGAGGARHWFGFEETIRFGIAGGRRLQLQSITNSRKSSWGFGGFFQEAPNVPSLSRSFALPFLRSPVLKRLTGQDKPALSVVWGNVTEGYGYACGGSGQPRRAAEGADASQRAAREEAQPEAEESAAVVVGS